MSRLRFDGTIDRLKRQINSDFSGNEKIFKKQAYPPAADALPR